MQKKMKAIVVATLLGVGILGAATAANAGINGSGFSIGTGYPDWAEDALAPKGRF